MPKGLTQFSLQMGEVVISTLQNRLAVHRAEQRGELRSIAPKLYSTNMTDDPERIIRRNLWPICSAFFPGALVADRTALENTPASDGSVFLVASRATDLALPGVVFRPRPGVGPIEGNDMRFVGTLWMSSQARALLENMRPSRSRASVRRTLSKEELELWLDSILRKGGEDTINRLRTQFKQLAPSLSMEKEAQELDGIIGALMGTRSAKLISHVGIARSRGLGYDPERLEAFEELRAILAKHPFPDRRARPNQSFLPFFEAYFSNYIEGTRFPVKDAYSIVYEGLTPHTRPEDAHDILGTYRIVSDLAEMTKLPTNARIFVERLRFRHSVIMGGRPATRPGEFKLERNEAGMTRFVEPALVEGTLSRGFEILKSLEHPMARALFAMFLVSEVHPFADGNGRIARIMMNAELAAQNLERIIIPTVFRTEYMQSLKNLTHNHRAEGLIRVMDFAQRYVSEVDFSDYGTADKILLATNAYAEPADAFGNGLKLILPSAAEEAKKSIAPAVTSRNNSPGSSSFSQKPE